VTQTPPEPAAPSIPKPESRLARGLRSALRWAVGIAVIFAAGIALLWFAQVRPLRAEVERLRSDLAAAQAELVTLQPLQAENERLQAEAGIAQSRVLLLEAMVDVTSAQVAMALGKPEDARAALQPTGGRLTELTGVLQDAQAREQVRQIQDRLTLVLSEVDRDAFAAQNDMEVLAGNLAALVSSLGEP
jgi:hypothetical protein